MSFACACLAVSKVSAIVTAEYLSDQWQGCLFKKLQFRACRIENFTKGEIFLRLKRSCIQSYQLWLIGFEFDTTQTLCKFNSTKLLKIPTYHRTIRSWTFISALAS